MPIARTTISKALPFAAASGSTIERTSSISAAEIDLFEIEVHLACLDLRQIENVVDQAKQMPAGIADLGEIGQKFVLSFVLRRLVQHLAVADDRVQRRPKLVAHAGEEGRFVLARRFELLVEIAELLGDPVDVGAPARPARRDCRP